MARGAMLHILRENERRTAAQDNSSSYCFSELCRIIASPEFALGLSMRIPKAISESPTQQSQEEAQSKHKCLRRPVMKGLE
jgi:hypothetical protein